MNPATFKNGIKLTGLAIVASFILSGCLGGSGGGGSGSTPDNGGISDNSGNNDTGNSNGSTPDNGGSSGDTSNDPLTFTFNGEAFTKIKLGDTSYQQADIEALIQALENKDIDLRNRIVVSGDTVDVNTTGDYRLKFSVTDSGNNTTEFEHTVRVADFGAMNTGFGGEGQGTWKSLPDSEGRDIITDTNGNSYVVGIEPAAEPVLKVWKLTSEGLANYDSFENQNGLTIDAPDAADSINDSVLKIKLDASGKLLIAGTVINSSYEMRPHLWRLNADGSVDNTFTFNGTRINNQNTYLEAFDVDVDGNLYVVGSFDEGDYTDIFVAKYSPEGAIDTSFGTDGFTLIAEGNDSVDFISDLAITKSGDILLAGQAEPDGANNRELNVWKLDSDGHLDTSFAVNGEFTYANNFANASMQAMVLDNQENILLLGGVATSIVDKEVIVLKLDSQGQLVESFANNGKLKLNSVTEEFFGKALVVDPENNAMLITGFDLMDPKAQVRAYDSQGNPAQYFGESGVASSDNTLPDPDDFFGLWLDRQTNSLFVTGTTGTKSDPRMFLMKLIN